MLHFSDENFFQEKETNLYNRLEQQLSKLKQNLFTGKLSIKATVNQSWEIFFYLGRIVYATGGTHPVRRWVRNLTLHCFDNNLKKINPEKRQELLTDISGLNSSQIKQSWEYYLLVSWVNQGKINREEILQYIQASVIEVLFEINQSIYQGINIITSLESTEPLEPQLILIDVKQAWLFAYNHWETWKNCQLGDISPNKGLLLLNAKKLEESISAQSYQMLVKFFNGQHTIREIALHVVQHSLTQVIASFIPYIKDGVIQLVNVTDFLSPVDLTNKILDDELISNDDKPLVACIDDSHLICKQMENICITSGYRYYSVVDPINALPIMLEKKPQMIFLDLVMPNTNGYEVCSIFRKISVFRETPIIIMTANHGLVDRLRGKVAGATNLITKPIIAENILNIVSKHLLTD